MAQRRTWTLALGGLATGLAVFVGHAAGEASRVVKEVTPITTHEGPIIAREGGPLVDAAKQGASTIKKMREGTEEEKVVAKAACATMKAYMSEQEPYDGYEDEIRTRVSDFSPVAIPRDVTEPLVKRAAMALTAASQGSGGFSYWYFRYCGV